MVAIARPTLPKNYTKTRPIRVMTANARAVLTLTDLACIDRAWKSFEGGPDDSSGNVIFQMIAPESHEKIWIVDRDGPDGYVTLMLPEDY
jgi:hypothetical protein